MRARGCTTTALGTAWQFHEREVTVGDGAFVSGKVGVRWRNKEGALICELMEQYVYLGPAPDGCPDCEWAFALDGTGIGWNGDCSLIEKEVDAEGYIEYHEREYYAPEYYGYSAYGTSMTGRPMRQVIWTYQREYWFSAQSNYMDDDSQHVAVDSGGVYRWWNGGGYPVRY